MIYEGKEYEKIVEGGSLVDGQAKVGDLVRVQFSYKCGRNYFVKLDEMDRHGNLVIEGFVIGNSRKCWFNQKKFSMEIYREVGIPTTVIKVSDTVNSPSHYNQTKIEAIDIIEDATAGYQSNVKYHIGNAIKYLIRAPFKNNTVEDLKKAVWYINRAIEKLEGEE